MRMNGYGEFVLPDGPEESRAETYRNCSRVDMKRLRKNAMHEERRLERTLNMQKELERLTCPNCGRRFRPCQPYQVYCTPACRREKYNEARRAEYAARKKARP